MRLIAIAVALLLAACASMPSRVDPLDPLAQRYVKLVLQVGVKEEGYIDAYHGPEAWRTQAKAHPLPLAALDSEADALARALDAVSDTGRPQIEIKRHAFLKAHVAAARFRLRMLSGARASFAEEAEGLFGVRPALRPLSSYDADLARADALATGEGTFAERVARARSRGEIPAARVRPVMEAAIAECRRRTRAHIVLPDNERFDLELVTHKPWGGYNYFQGDARSLIQINMDLPATVEGAVNLGCHEGYPGHHVQNVLMEKLFKNRGWVEYSVWPLFAPVGFIAEGTANAGVTLAFPDDDRRAFERDVLYPLAGIEAGDASAAAKVNEAMRALRGAEYTIADDFLAGRMDRAAAAAALSHYLAMTPERAQKRLDFITTYRSYIINYGLGEEMALAAIERAGPSPEARWKALETILSEPTLPSDLGVP